MKRERNADTNVCRLQQTSRQSQIMLVSREHQFLTGVKYLPVKELVKLLLTFNIVQHKDELHKGELHKGELHKGELKYVFTDNIHTYTAWVPESHGEQWSNTKTPYTQTQLLDHLLKLDIVRRVHTIEVEVQTSGGDKFTVEINASNRTEKELKNAIARHMEYHTNERRQRYKV